MPRKPTPDESALFRQAIAKLRPSNNSSPRKKQLIKTPDNNKERLFSCCYSRNNYLEPINANDFLFFQRNLAQKTLRKLRQGQYNAEAILDLHGYTVDDAAIALEDLLVYCLDTGKRFIRIIHGKGSNATLKTQLNSWLQDTGDVLAFCSAKRLDGGTGALYVLLKKQTYPEEDGYDSE